MKRIRSDLITEEQKSEYWFNTKTKSVEVGKQTLALNRLGPFPTREDAENALEILKSRSEAWSEEEEQERD